MRVLKTTFAVLAVLAAALVVPACHDDHPTGLAPVTYRPTTTHDFVTGSSNQTSETIAIVSSADLAFLETQSGVTQAAGNGLILGTVRESTSGMPAAGVTITPIDDANAAVGTVVYRNASGALQASLTQTSFVGSFVVFNVPPGRVNLRATAGAAGNASVTSVADEAAIVDMTATAPFSTFTWTGVTRSLSNVPGAGVAGATFTAFGGGAGVFPATSGAGGAFTVTAPPSLNTYRVQLTAGGFAPTLNVVTVGSGTLASPNGDLFLVDPTDPMFTPPSITLDPAKGIIRGVLMPPSGGADGYVVSVRHANGTPIGGVRYGGTSGAADVTLTSSSTNGIFYAYNVDAGTVLVTATKTGYSGGATVDVAAGGVTLVTIAPASLGGGTDPILVAGALRDASGASNVGFGSVSIEGRTGTSTADFFGIFALPGVPSNARLRVRATKP